MSKVSRFISGMRECFDDPLTDDHPRTRKFQKILEHVPGMASENKLALLNVAASVVEREEIYLEIGCWKGCSLIGAALGNPATRFFAIDDFSEYSGSQQELLDNIGSYEMADRVQFIDGDAFSLVQKGVLKGRKVGVYFYDGPHSYRDQYRALSLVEPYLAGEALVIVDDCNFPQVLRANRDFTRRRPGWSLVFEVASSYPGEPRWWNGLQVFAFQRPWGAGPPRRHYLLPARALLYDHLFPAIRRMAPTPLQRPLTRFRGFLLRDELREGKGFVGEGLPQAEGDAHQQPNVE